MGISTETREHAIAPVRDALMELIARSARGTRAALREFAAAYLRRLSADAAETMSPEELFAEVAGAFDFAARRGERPILVRAFNPAPAEHGYERPGSVLETNTEDLPFLVDSVRAALAAEGLTIQRVLHPVVGLERDDGGRDHRACCTRARRARASRSCTSTSTAGSTSRRSRRSRTRSARCSATSAARCSTSRRWPTAAGAWCRSPAPAPRATPTTRSTRPSRSSSGCSPTTSSSSATASTRSTTTRIGVVPGSGLGILADEASSTYARPQPLADLPEDRRERALEGDLLIVSKTNRLSTVHRHARMDYVGVRKVSADGRITGEARMLGLFTTKAYAEPASQTPLLNRKLRQILRHEDLIEGSHDYKAAVSLFDSFPKDELFSARTDDLRRAVVELLSLEGDRVRLLGRRSDDGRSASLIAALPAARYDAELLDALHGRCCASASGPTRSTRTPCSARASGSASTPPCTRPTASPTCRCASSSRS